MGIVVIVVVLLAVLAWCVILAFVAFTFVERHLLPESPTEEAVKDNLNHPMANVDLFSQDDNGQYESEARTHTNGNYVIGALCGATWFVAT